MTHTRHLPHKLPGVIFFPRSLEESLRIRLSILWPLDCLSSRRLIKVVDKFRKSGRSNIPRKIRVISEDINYTTIVRWKSSHKLIGGHIVNTFESNFVERISQSPLNKILKDMVFLKVSYRLLYSSLEILPLEKRSPITGIKGIEVNRMRGYRRKEHGRKSEITDFIPA